MKHTRTSTEGPARQRTRAGPLSSPPQRGEGDGRVAVVVVADAAADDARGGAGGGRVRSVVREGAVVRRRHPAEESGGERKGGDGGDDTGGTDACHVVPPEQVRTGFQPTTREVSE